MWCDDFDADLVKVVPGALEALGDTADTRLETYSRPTGGAINCPSAWNTSSGSTVAYFWTRPEGRPPSGYVTDDPVTPCTFWEAVRDEWVHGSLLAVNHVVAWSPPERLMYDLMADLRGWTVLDDERRERVRQSVRASLTAAAGRLRAILAAPCDIPEDGVPDGG
jgi:hypothetical protein